MKTTEPEPRLIWQRMAAAGKSRKLDYPAIAREAMKLADEGGIAELSMRNLASRLGAGTMSLYRYVDDRNDLLDLILDRAFGEIAMPPACSNDGRADVLKIAMETRRVMLRHAWLTPLLTSRPTLGPNYLRWFEFLLAATAAPRRSIEKQVRMVGTIWAFVSGSVGYELAEMEAYRHHQLSEERKREIAAPYLEEVLGSGEFPYLEKYVKGKNSASPEEDFVFGLNAVLDGLAAKRSGPG